MKTLWWVIGLGGLALLSTGCGDKTTVSNAPSPSAAPIPTTPIAADNRANPSVSRPFPELLVSEESGQTLPAPELIPTTTVLGRLPQVAVGRSDPFATVATSPVVVPAVPIPTAPTRVSSVPVPSAPILQTVPIAPAAIPPISVPASLPQPSAQQPLPQPSAIAPAPSHSANTVQVTGVVQIGTKLSAIVQVPNGGSRYVSAGDYLASGSIFVKQIEMLPDQEPRVILVQDGVEIVRTVGNAS